MKRLLMLSVVAAVGLAASPAAATGKMSCDAPKASWKSIDALQGKLKKDGWKVRKAKVDGGCYEVYGTDPKGRSVEAYFHPVSFKTLLVSRRGQVLFKAK
ncbi:PepSY domain-containing protein [Sphingomonas mesophila]|uniref:PepSY domain-containing protein n=1 Tax=Sphingomonas mesophila TaxID=2303576 RepID=UPI001F072F9E|nr:PepSY domain-containing protein [Sphingomonas mesophila]